MAPARREAIRSRWGIAAQRSTTHIRYRRHPRVASAADPDLSQCAGSLAVDKVCRHRVDSMRRWVAVDQNRFSLRQRIELVTSDHRCGLLRQRPNNAKFRSCRPAWRTSALSTVRGHGRSKGTATKRRALLSSCGSPLVAPPVAPPSLGFLGSSVHWRRALPDRVSTGVCQWPRIGPRDVSQGNDGQRCESGEELLPGSVPVAPSRFHRFHCHLVQSAFRFVEEATVRPIHESSSWPRHNLQHRLGGVSSRSVRVIASKPRQPLNPLVMMEYAQSTGNPASPYNRVRRAEYIVSAGARDAS